MFTFLGNLCELKIQNYSVLSSSKVIFEIQPQASYRRRRQSDCIVFNFFAYLCHLTFHEANIIHINHHLQIPVLLANITIRPQKANYVQKSFLWKLSESFQESFSLQESTFEVYF